MTDEEFWAVEEGLWTKGRAHYERWYSPDGLAGFPPPTGIIAGNGFVASLPETGGYERVEFENKALARPSETVTVLAYRGNGTRGGDISSSICTSTYAVQGGEWRLVQHQQTPISKG